MALVWVEVQRRAVVGGPGLASVSFSSCFVVVCMYVVVVALYLVHIYNIE